MVALLRRSVLMILNLIAKAKEIFYKDGKTVETALNEVNASLKNVLYVVSFDSTTGTLVTKSADYTG